MSNTETNGGVARPPKNFLELLGVPAEKEEQLNQARELLSLLVESGCVISIPKPRKEIRREVKIRHSRDVASDTDTYIQEEAGQEPEIIGWLIPFGDYEGFVIIDLDLVTSVRFIESDSREQYRNQYLYDIFSPGSILPQNIYVSGHQIHSHGLHLPFEDIGKRLTPNSPETIAQINECLEKALGESVEKLQTAISARRQNQETTISSMASLYQRLTKPPENQPPAPPPSLSPPQTT